MKMGKTALITGASGGIGLELARLAAADHYNLALIARSENKLKEIQKEFQEEYDIQVDVLPFDLAETDTAAEIFEELQDRDIEILINNAGFGDHDDFADAKWSKINSMIKVNIIALTELTHLFLPGMIKRGSGRILNVSSTAAFQPGPQMAVYFASKAYVQSLSEALAVEMKDKGITVTALCPGPTVSGFQGKADIIEDPDEKKPRMATAAEVAEYGYHAMMKGKTVAIHGTMNKILAASAGFKPGSFLSKL